MSYNAKVFNIMIASPGEVFEISNIGYKVADMIELSVIMAIFENDEGQ